MKPCLLDYNYDELNNLVLSLNEKSFRARQIFTALQSGLDFLEMTNLSKDLRERLNEDFLAQPVKIIKSLKSVDGTEKYLFSLADGNVIEGVKMEYKYGNTLCVSTQVGCRMNCAFCASGLNGLIRNLSAGEILGEVVAVNRYLGAGLGEKRKITNVVLMGSGEPLDNYENVVKFLRLLSDERGLNVSPRNVSLSTSGLVPEIIKLADENLPINLTVSLHAPTDEIRQKIMPVSKKYKISDIMNACSDYFDKTGRRYIFEYVLIKDLNADERCAVLLSDIVKGKPCHVNAIRLNDVKEKDLKGVTVKEAYRFVGKLNELGVSATLRRSMGSDIEGACGQLRRSYIMQNNK